MNSVELLGTTHSPGVFISHTSRDRSAAELASGDTSDRSQYRKRYLRQLIDEIAKGFAARHIKVWIDSREISAGQEFAQAICLSLVRCSAAILLVDRDALTSGYMQEEARLLGWRKILEPDLQVIPVLLGDVSAIDFAGSPLGRAGELSRLSNFTPTNRKQNRVAAAQTAIEICERVQLVPLEQKAARWVDDVAHFIAPAPAHALDEAARKLGIPADTLQAHTDKHALVAAALLNSSLPTAFQVMRTIAEYLPDRNLQAAKRRVAPLWVDLDSARALMRVSDAPHRDRIVHLIAGRLLPAAGHAILRASTSQDNVRTAKLGGVAGEDMVAELVDRYDDTLRAELNFESDDAPDDVQHHLSSSNTVVFALMNCDHVPVQVTRAVLIELMRRFPGVVFALVSTSSVQGSGTIRGRRIQLATDDQDDRRTMRLIREIHALSTEPAIADVD